MPPSTVTQELQPAAAALHEEWKYALQKLAAQVSEWARLEPEWRVDELSTSTITEEPLGSYTAPVVTIHTPTGRLMIEPIARNFPGRGIVEVYAWPTLFRVRLLLGEFDSDWQVRVDSGFVLHQEWNRKNFIQLANDLLGAS